MTAIWRSFAQRQTQWWPCRESSTECGAVTMATITISRVRQRKSAVDSHMFLGVTSVLWDIELVLLCLQIFYFHACKPLRWPGDSQRESGWFARIDPLFSERSRDSCESPQTCEFAISSARNAICKNGVQFGRTLTPWFARICESIRANRAI